MPELFADYFDESHEQFRDVCRRFAKEEISPFAYQWEEDGIFLSPLLGAERPSRRRANSAATRYRAAASRASRTAFV